MNKFAIFSFVVAAFLVGGNDAALTEAQKSKIYGKLLTTSLDCMKEFPLTLEHMTSLRSKVVPDDEMVKCFTHCLYKRLGLMDDTGKLSEKTARAAIKKVFKEGNEMAAKVEDLIGKCMHVNEAETSDGDKGCDRAKLAFECFIENASDLGLDLDF